MSKITAIIDSTASKTNMSIKLDEDVHELYEEVKDLLKEAGLGKLNMNRSLQPVIKSILMDAKHQAQEKLHKKQAKKSKEQQITEPA
ncbi:MAG: hypothetical protein CMD81_08105 [Gammaproteobacteria bacterium]|nr:hypothetical protein [Gammaproteobacteria bacterium]MBK82268.1 hypothetical protein [Gammaproteobacteria bacterium]MBK83779.1 hypothetical protein [Gammaproteobacteria bacterium]HCV05152.1 hypothetical protein [Pseudoalteromonas sp.]|tara:strand:+ start:201 stop:461 length:261 start_codon:yes stop_codon:yes gene_type:complete